MFRWIREKLGVGGAAGICLVAVVILVFAVFRREDVAAEDAAKRVYICAETMRTFEYVAQEGDKAPMMSPYSKKRTGWPAEKCFWTREGGAKRIPTYVLLNDYVGKEGPTICPDCGRKVFFHNRMPPPSKWRELAEREAAAGGKPAD